MIEREHVGLTLTWDVFKCNETNQNNEEIELNRKLMLDERKQACQEIKEKFGIEIDVEFVLDNEEIGGDVEWLTDN